jgi:hypothetical protein
MAKFQQQELPVTMKTKTTMMPMMETLTLKLPATAKTCHPQVKVRQQRLWNGR